ncbi:MAG: nucleotidyltransferase family protein [Candidatus Izemoplasmatales bacterium]
MNETLSTLFSMVVCALNHQPFSKAITNDQTLYQVARDNGFSGLVFSSLLKANLSAAVYHDFQRDFYQYKAKDVVQNLAIREITQLFANAEIKHMYLKGAFLKTIYPESYMRSMGDIDILIESQTMSEVHHLFAEAGYKLQSVGPTHDLFTKGKDIIVEVHPGIDKHFEANHQAVMNDIWEHTNLISGYEYRLDKEYQVIYLLCHLAKHMKSSGVGLRQILDIGILLNDTKDTVNTNQLSILLSQTKLMRFFETIQWLNEKWFGLQPLQGTIYPEDFTDDFLGEVTTFIAASGTHGKAKGFNTMLPRLSYYTGVNKSVRVGKASAIFHVLFLPYDEMKSGRPYLQKHKWLLPFAWIGRWWKLLFKTTKRSLKKLHELSIDANTVSHQAEIDKKIGL